MAIIKMRTIGERTKVKGFLIDRLTKVSKSSPPAFIFANKRKDKVIGLAMWEIISTTKKKGAIKGMGPIKCLI